MQLKNQQVILLYPTYDIPPIDDQALDLSLSLKFQNLKAYWSYPLIAKFALLI